MPQNCVLKIFGLFLVWQLLLQITLAMPAIDEDHYRELARNFAPWTMAYPQYENPCQNTIDVPWSYLMPLHKRNSELINSLLSLPKTMNDAGK